MGEGYRRIGRQCKTVTDRIEGLPDGARVAIAASAAQRLMDDHLNEPEERRRQFTVGWAPALSLIWQLVLAPNPEADKALRSQLEGYYSGPYCHELGDDALPGADEDAAAAAIYAVEAYCRRKAKSAASSVLRMVNAADRRVEALLEDPMSHEAEERRVQAEQEELDRISAGLEILEQEGVTQASIKELRKIFGIRAA